MAGACAGEGASQPGAKGCTNDNASQTRCNKPQPQSATNKEGQAGVHRLAPGIRLCVQRPAFYDHEHHSGGAAHLLALAAAVFLADLPALALPARLWEWVCSPDAVASGRPEVLHDALGSLAVVVAAGMGGCRALRRCRQSTRGHSLWGTRRSWSQSVSPGPPGVAVPD
jgi:hypothetical protein